MVRPALDYFGERMDPRLVITAGWPPTRLAVEPVVSLLLAEGGMPSPRPLRCAIEPGDGTRYAFALTVRVQGTAVPTLVVERLQGGDRRGAVVGTLSVPLDATALSPEACWSLAQGNVWSATLCAWWIATLLGVIADVRQAEDAD